jgi:hypothetical protein
MTDMATACALEFTAGKCKLDEISKLISGNYTQINPSVIIFKLLIYERPYLLGQ